MADEFNKGMAASFREFHALTGSEQVTIGAEKVDAIVDTGEERIEIGPAGNRRVFSGSMSMLAADWVRLGMGVGTKVVLPDGQEARVEVKPTLGASADGVIEVLLRAQ